MGARFGGATECSICTSKATPVRSHSELADPHRVGESQYHHSHVIITCCGPLTECFSRVLVVIVVIVRRSASVVVAA